MAARAVLLDTDVFSALYVTPRDIALKQGHPVDDWADAVTGYRVLISFQTRAEILFGVYDAGWGERRLGPVRERLDATPTVDEDRDVVEAFAQLTFECRKSGHALAAKEHTGDRWIAACAIAKDLPLLAKDGIYVNSPSVVLFETGTDWVPGLLPERLNYTFSGSESAQCPDPPYERECARRSLF